MNIEPKGAFTQNLWHRIEPIFEKMLTCDFIVQLGKGTLSSKSFAHYLSQDVIYLRQDNQALSMLASKTTNSSHHRFFDTLATDGIAMEQILRKEYLTHFKVHEAVEQSPAFKAYGEYLLQHASNSSADVTAAALLPCFWVYAATGNQVILISKPGNPYQKFIDTYAGEEYEVYVNQYIEIVEELGRQASPEMQQRMTDAFIRSTEMELMVFEESARVS